MKNVALKITVANLISCLRSYEESRGVRLDFVLYNFPDSPRYNEMWISKRTDNGAILEFSVTNREGYSNRVNLTELCEIENFYFNVAGNTTLEALNISQIANQQRENSILEILRTMKTKVQPNDGQRLCIGYWPGFGSPDIREVRRITENGVVLPDGVEVTPNLINTAFYFARSGVTGLITFT